MTLHVANLDVGPLTKLIPPKYYHAYTRPK